MVGVLFFFTARDENQIDTLSAHPAVVVNVTGFQWSWSFQYPQYKVTGAKALCGQADVCEVGQTWNGVIPGNEGQMPLLEIPEHETVRFNLVSADVIHSFWIVPFNFKRDVVPGHPNHFQVTATAPSTSIGRCSELCGLYHSRMLFRVKIVPQAEFNTWIQQQQAQQNAVDRRPRAQITPGVHSDRDSESRAGAAGTDAPPGYRKGSLLADWLSSTDHKIIGHLYLITSFGFFLIGGLMAMIMRAQLMGPNNHIVSDQQYNELFTMHGTIMLLLFATPLFVGFANEIMPLQIGAPDVAFPRLNLLVLLHVPVRRPDPAGQLPDPGRRGLVRLVRLLAADSARCTRRASAATCGSWAWSWPAWAPSWAASTSSRRSCACGRRA